MTNTRHSVPSRPDRVEANLLYSTLNTMLSAVARPALRSQALARARGFHASRVARSADHDYHVGSQI